ncbi:MAG: hypothetical protein PHH27_02600 [Candidatus Colwellbacteria bacterium]|nr:hypothetical protein [Candidatus Colwellbacteria bacterium]
MITTLLGGIFLIIIGKKFSFPEKRKWIIILLGILSILVGLAHFVCQTAKN